MAVLALFHLLGKTTTLIQVASKAHRLTLSCNVPLLLIIKETENGENAVILVSEITPLPRMLDSILLKISTLCCQISLDSSIFGISYASFSKGFKIVFIYLFF